MKIYFELIEKADLAVGNIAAVYMKTGAKAWLGNITSIYTDEYDKYIVMKTVDGLEIHLVELDVYEIYIAKAEW